MNEYKKVEVLKYVREGLANGTLEPFEAEKIARIHARVGQVGEEVISWSVDENGNEVLEKEGVVSISEETGKPGWVATKIDDNLNFIVDNNNHVNQWIIDDETFTKKYEIDTINGDGIYKPTGGIQIFVRINENITVFQWESNMTVAAGGYINITNPDDMYAISQRDFNDTYRPVNNDSKKKIK